MFHVLKTLPTFKVHLSSSLSRLDAEAMRSIIMMDDENRNGEEDVS
jgi:hypothetical protein